MLDFFEQMKLEVCSRKSNRRSPQTSIYWVEHFASSLLLNTHHDARACFAKSRFPQTGTRPTEPLSMLTLLPLAHRRGITFATRRVFHDARSHEHTKVDQRWPEWQVVIGVETHAQIKSRRKLFSSRSISAGAPHQSLILDSLLIRHADPRVLSPRIA